MDVHNFREINLRAELSNTEKHRRITTTRTNVDALKSEREDEEQWTLCVQTIKTAAETVLGSGHPGIIE